MSLYRPRLPSNTLAFLTSAYLVLMTNFTFWRKGFSYFVGHEVQMVTFGFGLFLLIGAMLSALTIKFVTKTFAIALILIAAVASYYVDTFGIVIDRDMIQNVVLTTPSEAKHLLTLNFILHILGFGLVPAALVAWTRIDYPRPWPQARRNAIAFVACVAGALAITLTNYAGFAATLREHRDLFASFNPVAPISSTFRYVARQFRDKNIVAAPLGEDARLGRRIAAARKTVVTVVVVGETARAQNFSLTGYDRPTNPELARRDVIAFRDVTSCGTATAVSLPCMFSVYTRAQYSETKARATENLTDVLRHSGIDVDWYDNNTGSMRVAERIDYEFMPNTEDPRFCKSGECYDEILLDRLARKLKDTKGNTVVILHQLGSHGPAYHQRYPYSLRKFTPDCQTAQFADCTQAQIVNSYDNTILYTDNFLAEVIDLLQSHTEFATSMLYMSDHGESLGESGIYLHGAPYFIAPATQTHVPFITWLSEDFRSTMDIDTTCLRSRVDASFSHDNLFHTVLGMMDVETKVHDKALDVTAGCRAGPKVANAGHP